MPKIPPLHFLARAANPVRNFSVIAVSDMSINLNAALQGCQLRNTGMYHRLGKTLPLIG